ERRATSECDTALTGDLRTALETHHTRTQAEVNQCWTEWRSPAQRHNGVYQALQPAKDRFGHRWDQAVKHGDTEQLDQLVEFRSALTQYPKASAFFSQILDYGDQFYAKLAAYANLLARLLTNFTVDEPDPTAVDISDVVLTHYKLEKLRDEANLGLSSQDTPGLQGLTEAGMSRTIEQERAAMTEVIDKVNKYLGDLDASDEYKVGALRLLNTQIAADPTLQQQYQHNTAIDFRHSPALVNISEDALWAHESHTDELITRLRELPDQDRIQLLLDTGLLDAL